MSDDNDAPSSLAAYPLWVADYEVDQPSLPQGWTTWLLWQNSEDGTVAGVDGAVDLDEVNGTLADLQAVTKA